MPPKAKALKQTAHVLHRPDMYVGSTRRTSRDVFVVEDGKIILKSIKCAPAQERVVVEAISNAADNVIRSREARAKVKTLAVDINPEEGSMWIQNDGLTPPVVKHTRADDDEPEEVEGMWIPEMVFGMLNAGTNFDDEEERTAVGRNGCGVGLLNIFSKEFTLEIQDPQNKHTYQQFWSNNMSNKTTPVIRSYSKKTGTTKVKWVLDFARFHCDHLEDDFVQLITKHCYDMSFITGLPVVLNENPINIESIDEYAQLYFNDELEEFIVHNVPTGPRGEVSKCLVCRAPDRSSGIVSFANGVYTSGGGVHVTEWYKTIFAGLAKKLNNKHKSAKFTPKELSELFWVFLDARVNKPEFTDQSKHTLANPTVRIDFPDSKLLKIMKWESLEEQIQEILTRKDLMVLKKADSKKKATKVEGLQPANFAGTAKAKDCILVITEGLSAQTFADKGLNGNHDYVGTFAIRGKFLNVRKKKADKIAGNKEVQGINQALGLRFGEDYSTPEARKTLRYGRVRALADSDSVAGHTPMLVKGGKNINVLRIDELGGEWMVNPESGKEYSLLKEDLCVWTDNGWSKIKYVMRHMVTKKMFRVCTHTGCVDVTEDHSLLDMDANEITPKDIGVGSNLLHSYPKLVENQAHIPTHLEEMKYYELYKLCAECKIPQYAFLNREMMIEKIRQYQSEHNAVINVDYKVDEDEAWLMGFWWADGTCGEYSYTTTYKNPKRPRAYTFNRHSYNWSITNTNLEYLERALSICEDYYPEYNFVIKTCAKRKESYAQPYKLIMNGNKQIADFVTQYREWFYTTNREKRIPPFILNASRDSRLAFTEGFYAGDGDKAGRDKNGAMKFSVNSQISTAGLYWLYSSLGYTVSVNIRHDKPLVYTLIVSSVRRSYWRDPCAVKKIEQLPHREQYVYDIETDDHHFQAGVGQIIVHNTDGFHIECLLLNYFHYLFPSLLEIPGFFESERTPIIRTRFRSETKSFYTKREYEEFMRTTKKKWDISHYKGLGTHSDAEILDCYNKRVKPYSLDEETGNMMSMVFGGTGKIATDKRKDWLLTYDPYDVRGEETSDISEVLDKRLIHYSIDSCKRGLPCLVDGLKESQRKLVFASVKRKLKAPTKPVKTAQLANGTAEVTNYEHGEQSLSDTLTKMNQSFAGSNNIPLFEAHGQFGSLKAGGDDAANARYTFTRLSKLFFYLFREEDERILTYLVQEGMSVEPEYFYPILPVLLINGCSMGAGTGWSCTCPCYNPRDVAEAVKEWIRCVNEEESFEEPELTPWYNGYQGEIVKDTDTRFKSSGVVTRESGNKARITALPIGYWTNRFRDKLQELKADKRIKSSSDHSKADDVNFVVNEQSDGLKCTVDSLKLSDYISISNIVCFDSEGKIRRYSVGELISEFCEVRLIAYKVRKDKCLEEWRVELLRQKNKARFLKQIIDEELVIYRVPRKQVEKLLEQAEYDKFSTKENKAEGYEYLLDMKITSFTQEYLNNLRDKILAQKKKIKNLEAKAPADWWVEEIDEFLANY